MMGFAAAIPIIPRQCQFEHEIRGLLRTREVERHGIG